MWTKEDELSKLASLEALQFPSLPVQEIPSAPTAWPNWPKEAQPTITDQAAAERLGMNIERFKEIQCYTLELRKKYPHMKPTRIQRKVTEHFKIKLT
ncbi:hypothetical protein [Chitinophaga tropicalis]|uniref:Uncharacterized protein n=1 Tax=Chitinophaga tropicalis TaxID=2683588 RepID=A0A7K1UAG6_9BACT|nr:hypothetical protein [Chitinophaga tropicalis]MVT11371.1 hypothetical protein [Chitinophaga tropicalis]